MSVITWCWPTSPELNEIGADDLYFQQDGAPPEYGNSNVYANQPAMLEELENNIQHTIDEIRNHGSHFVDILCKS